MSYQYKLSLCIAVKNEAAYMDEFLEHYVNQGVEHFFIVNNNSTDGIEELIANHKYNNKITLINDTTDMKYTQGNCSNIHIDMMNRNVYQLIKESSEWGIFVDMDEFMYGKNGYTLSSYIDTLEKDINCVYVYWSLMKPVIESDGNIAESFSIKKSIKRINLDLFEKTPSMIQWSSRFGKSLFRTSALIDERKFWIHKMPILGKKITNYNSIITSHYDNVDDIIMNEGNYSKLNIVLNHYAIRNKKDYIRRIETTNTTNDTTKKHYSQSLIDFCNLSDDFFVNDYSLCD